MGLGMALALSSGSRRRAGSCLRPPLSKALKKFHSKPSTLNPDPAKQQLAKSPSHRIGTALRFRAPQGLQNRAFREFTALARVLSQAWRSRRG